MALTTASSRVMVTRQPETDTPKSASPRGGAPNLAEVLPDGVQLMRVHGGPDERRRALVARMPGRPDGAVVTVIDALIQGAANRDA
jgi:hypothetical protein